MLLGYLTRNTYMKRYYGTFVFFFRFIYFRKLQLSVSHRKGSSSAVCGSCLYNKLSFRSIICTHDLTAWIGVKIESNAWHTILKIKINKMFFLLFCLTPFSSVVCFRSLPVFFAILLPC